MKGGINTYGYVGGKPIRYTDSSGLCPWCVIIIYLPEINAAGITVAEAVGGVSLGGGGVMAARTIAAEAGSVQTFKSWAAAKNALGSTAANPIHHVVEQCQANVNRSGFPLSQINSTDNLIRLDKATHDAISAFYSGRAPGGGTIRDTLSGLPFEQQFDFGLDVVQRALNGTL